MIYEPLLTIPIPQWCWTPLFFQEQSRLQQQLLDLQASCKEPENGGQFSQFAWKSGTPPRKSQYCSLFSKHYILQWSAMNFAKLKAKEHLQETLKFMISRCEQPGDFTHAGILSHLNMGINYNDGTQKKLGSQSARMRTREYVKAQGTTDCNFGE